METSSGCTDAFHGPGTQNTCPDVGGLPDIHIWTRILLIPFIDCIGIP